jgi:GNAT superfamily N-acetyltransferase
MLDDYAKRIAAGQAWVLEEAGAILGVLVLEDADEALLLDNVAVAPEAQGTGYGRKLIAFAEAEARRRGRKEIRLYTHALMTENQAHYHRLGFRQTHRASENGYDRVFMSKALA